MTAAVDAHHGGSHVKRRPGTAALWLAAAAALLLVLPPPGLPSFPMLLPKQSGPPRCSMDTLDGLLDANDTSWATWAAAVQNRSSSSGGGGGDDGGGGTAETPPWRPPWLRLRRCSLRRFSAEEARQCLAGRPLVMIGDSVTRYQFLTLLHFLEFGRWPTPGLGSPGRPSPVIEREWEGGWNEFYKGTTLPFGDSQQCRCYREGAWDIREDRFYRSGDVSATFYMWFGFPLKPLTGLWGFPPYSNATACAPGECSAEPDWALPLDQAIRQVVSRFRPYTIVLNSGLWRTPEKDPWWPPEVFDAIMQAVNEVVAPQRGQAIWKTTTYKRGDGVQREFDDVPLAHAKKNGWRVMDAWRLTQAALELQSSPWVDDVHYMGYIYAELNQYLLNMIC